MNKTKSLCVDTPPVLLTADDWIEIDAALGTKIHGLRKAMADGDDPMTYTQLSRWITHLQRIQQKIGGDGIEAAKKGTITILRGGKPL